MADTDKLAAEMLAGLEGVTPGPWTWGSKYVCRLDGTRYERLFQTSTGENEGGDSQWELNAAHIARCSPDNIRTLLEERSAREATISALEAENKRLREALEPSAETKADYSGEIELTLTRIDEFGDEVEEKRLLPWTVIKDVMAMIRERARDISRNRRES